MTDNHWQPKLDLHRPNQTKTMDKAAQPTANFYFGGLDKTGLIPPTENTDKSSTAYIIFQNDRLHARVKELEDQVHELTAEKEELENDNESLETSKTSLKGYVSNQAEYNRLSKQLVEVYDEYINGVNKHKEELEWNVKAFGITFIVFEVCLLLYKLYCFDIFAVVELLILNGCVAFIISKVYKSYCEIVKFKNIKNLQRVVKIKEGMRDASKGIDLLSNVLTDLFDRL